jgi:hypothetical protein
MRQMRNAYKILVRKPEQKRSLTRPKNRWEDIIIIIIIIIIEIR